MKHSNSISKYAICAPNRLNAPIKYGVSFSRGIRINIGEATFIFISGTASVDKNGKTHCPNNFKAQVKRTFDNLTALLKSERATWHDVVKTDCFLKSMKSYKEFNEHRNLFYKQQKLQPLPASVCVEAPLCRPDLLVEISLLAVIKN